MTSPADIPVRVVSGDAEVTLREIAGGQPLLVVLTRHMDCPYCEVHLGRVIHARDTLGRVAVVAHGDAAELREHYRYLPPEFVVVTDPDQTLYDAFATTRLNKASELRVRAWNLLTYGVRHIARGGKVGRPGQDLLQLGGDAVLGSDGNVAWIHRARRADDRRSVTALAEQLHRTA